jgi:RNA polymerase sigma factor (sigma-70 family)
MIRPVVDMEVHGNPPASGRRAPPPKVTDRMTAALGSHSSRRARFRAVYDTNYHRVLGYALRRTASREDAEDVVAETFLTAWRRLEEVPHGSGARPWLYGVARNALANQRRGERRRGRLSGRLHAEPTLADWHWADANDELASVAPAFARLREKDRELLALAAWEELGPGEIATVLGCSRNAARIRLHRARRRLARELQSTEVDATRWSLISVESEQAMSREPR